MNRCWHSSSESTCFFLVVFLVLGWSLLRATFPHRLLVSVGIPKWISIHVGSPLLYLDGGKPADILLIGSSLLLAPPFRFLDDEKEGTRCMAEGKRLFLSQCYEKALQEGLRAKYFVVNCAVPGSVADDQRIIMDAVVNSQVKPKLVIYAFSPRDLIDNYMSKAPRENPVYQTFQFAKDYSGKPEKNLDKIFEREYRFGELVRRYVKGEVSSSAAKRLGRPSSLWEAVNQYKGGEAETVDQELEPAAKLKDDLAVYQQRYLPFRKDYFDFQLNSFRQLLQVCKDHSVPIIILHMPIAESNLALLQPDIITTYATATSEACKSAGIEQIDLRTLKGKPFTSADFIDSCHLSRAGSIKFLAEFAQSLKNSRTMQRAFATN